MNAAVEENVPSTSSKPTPSPVKKNKKGKVRYL